MNFNNSFTTLDFFISLSATLGVCTANQWLDYYSSLDEYRRYDLAIFFKYLSLGVKMQYSHQSFRLKSNNKMARSLSFMSPNNLELKLTIQEFPGYDVFEQRLFFCKVNLDLLELNNLASKEVKKESDQDSSEK